MTTDPYLTGNRRPVTLGKTGVLLINLGTPERADARSVRRYLREFLSDRRVVDYPRILWLPILYGIILNVRPAKTAEAYAKIWREESNESPLRYYTRQQAEFLNQHLGTDDLVIDWAMRYGTPSIDEKLKVFRTQGCDRIVIAPLYPQYSGTTTGTVEDKVTDVLQRLDWQPALRTVPAHHDHPAYIKALAELARTHVKNHASERIVLSFHGLPERYVNNGDPYQEHCEITVQLLRKEMDWAEDFAPVAYQSRFGREKWLGPSTEEVIIEAAQKDLKNISVMTPGFVSDCIETLEEVGIDLAGTFTAHGGETLTLIPCLNDSPGMIDLLANIVGAEIKGWSSTAKLAQEIVG